MVSKPFYPKPTTPVIGFNMGTLLNRKPTKGDIGLEIECEGNKFKKEGLPAPWTYHKDNSLRGLDNAEYVLGKPIEFKRVPEAIDVLWGMMNAYGTVLDVSNRTSVHVHLNMQKFHMNRLTSFFALYFAVEELLTQWCGEHRVGNLFCLRAKDAPAAVTQLKKFIQTDGKYNLRDHLHYAALNTNALYKYGSIEVRTLRGVNDPNIILDWVAILQRLYELSADLKDPREVVSNFSGGGALSFLEMILSDKLPIIREGISYTDQQVENAMYEGIRLAQDLCYCRDWNLYQPTDVKNDPFGRDAKKMAVAMAQMQAYSQHDMEILQAMQNAQPGSLLNPFNSPPPLAPSPQWTTIALNTAPQPAFAEEYPPEPSDDVEEDLDEEDYPEMDDDDYEPDELSE